MNKTVQRFLPILTNGTRSIISPLISIAFSFIVVRFFSKQLWGEFVEYVLFFLIANLICEWGNKGYLLRIFSKSPKDIVYNWQNFFLARIPICLLVGMSLFFFFPWTLAPYLVLWLIGSFVYNSIVTVIFYNRDYLTSIGIETIAFLAVIIQLYIYKDSSSLILLIRSYSIGILIKTLLSIIYSPALFQFKSFKFRFLILKTGLPFFILGITGFLHSKVDVYVYSFFYSGEPLGEYQIISGFFFFATSLITLLLYPYIRNFYRLKSTSILKVKKLMIRYGIFINLIVVSFIYIALNYGFQITLSPIQIIIGYFISFPPYVYVAHIYYLFKEKKENTVVKISLYSFLLNFIVSLLMLYLDYNITGVLLANALAQLFCMIYSLKFRIYEH